MQFQEEGCDNCDPGMPINDDEVLHQCTHNFSGMIAVMNPEKSWCARWTRKSVPFCPTVQAVYRKQGGICIRGIVASHVWVGVAKC